MEITDALSPVAKGTLARAARLPRIRAVNAVVAALLSVGAGLLITCQQLDAAIGRTLDLGRSWSPTQLTGIGWSQDRWAGWEFIGTVAGDAHACVIAFAVVDAVFAVVYTALLLKWIQAVSTDSVRLPAAAICALFLDLSESALIPSANHLATLLVVISNVKWIVLLGILITLVAKTKLRHTVALVLLALYNHRYTTLLVAPILLLGLGTGSALLEQLPDIQRRWAESWSGVWHFIAAAAMSMLLAIAGFVVGRLRSHHVWRRTLALPPTDERPLPSLVVWFAAPALLALAAVADRIAGMRVEWVPFGIVVGTSLAIGTTSWALRAGMRNPQWHDRIAAWHITRPQRRPITDGQRFPVTALVGDVLAGTVPLVAGLGAIRAFTPTVAFGDPTLWDWLFLVAGWLVVASVWPFHARFVATLRTRSDALASSANPSGQSRLVAALTPGAEYRPGVSRVPKIVLAASVVLLVVLGLFPRFFADWVGVVATIQLAVAALSLMVASTVILMQPTGSPEAFWKLKIPFTPVSTLLLAAVVVVSIAGSTTVVHEIRHLPGEVPVRPTMADAFASWLSADGAATCTIDIGGRAVRPMLLFAAEGGGIRAAYWTATGLDRIAESVAESGRNSVCGSAFLSTGASGGSVGLSIAAVSAPGNATAAVRSVAGPNALGAAADGMLIRDSIYSATGIPFPAPGLGDPATEWIDRAGLIEKSWETNIPALGEPWVPAVADPGWHHSAPGALVLNGTSAATRCRVLISQITLDPGGQTTCGSTVAGSVDLVECAGQIRKSTAALLSGRFPYVTPSGVVENCPNSDQIVDGGYADNSGTGTMNDLLPGILAGVRTHNDCVLRDGDCGGSNAVVLPMLVYLDNGGGNDIAAKPPKRQLEVLIPPLTFIGAKASLYSDTSQLQRATRALALDNLWDTSTAAGQRLKSDVEKVRPDAVFVFYQSTGPAVESPLGWVLSNSAQAGLDEAAEQQNAAVAQVPYGRIAALVGLLTGHPR